MVSIHTLPPVDKTQSTFFYSLTFTTGKDINMLFDLNNIVLVFVIPPKARV